MSMIIKRKLSCNSNNNLDYRTVFLCIMVKNQFLIANNQKHIELAKYT